MAQALLIPLVEDDSYGLNYQNGNKSIMQGNWWCLSGKTESLGASKWWAKINHDMLAVWKHLNEKVWKYAKHVNIELGALTVERYEQDVQIILTYLKNWTLNIWHSDHPISNTATGSIATGNEQK